LVAGAALAALGACSPKENGTLLVVRVDTDLAIPTAINAVTIHVEPERGGKTTDTFSLANRVGLPVTLCLRPKGDPNFGLQVTASGLLDMKAVVSQTASVRFVPGEAKEFTLFLSSDCVGAGTMCKSDETCVRGSSCIAKTLVGQLRPYKTPPQ